jgi:hypothetical protein
MKSQKSALFAAISKAGNTILYSESMGAMMHNRCARICTVIFKNI